MQRQNAPVKRLNRFRHIISVLVKHGFGEILNRIRVWESVNIHKRLLKHTHPVTELTTAHRLRQAIEELGPSFIKLGQILSTRPDLIAPDFITELKKLQTSVRFIPAENIRGIVESELGQPISEIFSDFDDRPLAAASLAQVHRAVYQGEQVVLKVQRPDIAEIIEIDIGIMHSLAALVERYSSTLYLANPRGMVEEFAEQVGKELDFRMEASNIRRFAGNFAGNDTVHIPRVYSELSTRRVITMEYLEGINISDIQTLSEKGYDLQLIAQRGAAIGFEATFQHGFFHADPHPGNLFVLPDNVIGLVDFGMMATLSLRDRERLGRLVYFVSVRDEKRGARALNEIMESEEVIPAEELEPSMAAIIQEFSDTESHQLRLAGMLFAMMRAVMRHGGKLRPQLIWVSKSIAIQEDIALSLDSHFDIMELSKPYARKVLTGKLNPLSQLSEIYYWMTDALNLVKDLPYDASIIVREFRKGHIKIEFDHLGLEPIRKTMDRVANRTSLTLIISSLLISSSLLVLAKVPPFIGDVPLFGFIGFVLAVILGIFLVISVRKR